MECGYEWHHGCALHALVRPTYHTHCTTLAQTTHPLHPLHRYCTSKAEIDNALRVIQESLGPLPLFTLGEEEDADEAAADATRPAAPTAPQVKARPAVLADGSYATQIAYVEAPVPGVVTSSQPNMRALLLSGEFFLGAVMAATLTKLVLRLRGLIKDPAALHRVTAQSLRMIAAVLAFGVSSVATQPLDSDSRDRMLACVEVLTSEDAGLANVWLQSCKSSFVTMLQVCCVLLVWGVFLGGRGGVGGLRGM